MEFAFGYPLHKFVFRLAELTENERQLHVTFGKYRVGSRTPPETLWHETP